MDAREAHEAPHADPADGDLVRTDILTAKTGLATDYFSCLRLGDPVGHVAAVESVLAHLVKGHRAGVSQHALVGRANHHAEKTLRALLRCLAQGHDVRRDCSGMSLAGFHLFGRIGLERKNPAYLFEEEFSIDYQVANDGKRAYRFEKEFPST